MKKRILALLVLVSMGSMVFAGTRDRDDRDSDRSGGRGERNHFIENETTVSFEGTIKLVNGEMPTITDGKTTYTVMAPFEELVDLEIKDGLKVIVEGVERNARMVWDGSEKVLFLTKITIDGKTTTIDRDRSNMGFAMGDRRMSNDDDCLSRGPNR